MVEAESHPTRTISRQQVSCEAGPHALALAARAAAMARGYEGQGAAFVG
jgi:hypothetical protein